MGHFLEMQNIRKMLGKIPTDQQEFYFSDRFGGGDRGGRDSRSSFGGSDRGGFGGGSRGTFKHCFKFSRLRLLPRINM